MSVLKKCPFCGNRAIIFPRDLIKEKNIINEMEESFNNVFYSIECEHCGASIASISLKKVIDKWNRRI